MKTFSAAQIEEFNLIFSRATKAHKKGHLPAAQRDYERLLALFPQAPLLHYNLGLVDFARQEYHRAAQCFLRATELQPNEADAWYNLGLCRKKLGELAAAVSAYEHYLELAPQSVDGHYNLGNCHQEMHQFGQAIICYEKALALEPDHLSANNNLAYVYHREGLVGEAIVRYQEVLRLKPGHQAAAHMLAALCGDKVTRTPVDYVREVFDQYSERFEESLVDTLGYQVPNQLRQLLQRRQEGRRFHRALDLGCGTGLCGEAFGDLAERLIGVDLSPKMLAVAKEKKVYEQLHDREIIEYLREANDIFELIIAADVFGYVGDLEEVFSLLRQRITEDGCCCFSTEAIAAESYRLQMTGRFAHAPEYVTTLAEETGWQVAERTPTVIRHEKGEPVRGDLWVFQPRP
jgi:predicted TPR repeat methyltransferase